MENEKMDMIKEIIKIGGDNIKITTLPEDSNISIQYRIYKEIPDDSYIEWLVKYSVYFSNGKKQNMHVSFSRAKFQKLDLPQGNIESIEFPPFDLPSEGCFFELEVQKGRDRINVQNPLSSFRNFLDSRINSRILFSGAFGQGKTTFLNFFFDESYKDNYTVFRVFPVNYSVASNEDIFRYVKSDILFQLLGCDVDFDKQEISIIQSFQEYVYLNPKETIFSFLKTISKLNARTEILAKSIDALNNFLEVIRGYQKSQNQDNFEQTKTYLQEIYEKEGSLFEDNFYTQLIRQLLEQIKENTKKPNVLIIEDLDRMDPDHIFRILNVISAHYDTYKFNSQTESYNKFGFDKIILVCDIDNIRNIFHHKYGEKTDFQGYINKYYSSKPYYFNNTQTILKFIETQLETIIPSNKFFLCILKILLFENQISLRETLKLTSYDFTQYQIEINGFHLKRGPFTKSLAFLSNIYTPEILINKFESSKLRVGKKQIISYNDMSVFLIGAICNERDSNITKYKNVYYTFEYNEDFNESVFSTVKIIEKKRIENGANVSNRFTRTDFYDLLIENVKKIKESIED